ncbi:MAG: asparagine synthase-related protein, partial [Candidatus Diapherotrites archaeon]|nr:asparagine synthase-related protein [Candidatus Diapherotrites archaeon]
DRTVFGFYTTDRLSMGHARLTIRGQESGFQPVLGNGTALVYNGEIYNTQEIERRLGQSFESDTITLDAALNKFGIGIVSDLEGEFAFAYYTQNTLYLARDALGVKPLYYFASPRRVVFASELKALIPRLAEPPTLYPLDTQSYVKPYGNYTPIAQIKQVLPGHYLECTQNAGEIRIREHRYHSFQNQPVIQDPVHAREKLKATLYDCTRRMMISDTKMGILLSGGVDSAILAQAASQHAPYTLNAYCVGTSEQNEFEFAQEIADHNGLHLRTIELTADEIAGTLETVIQKTETYDAGILPTAIAMNKLFEPIREKAVLSGEGPDELFGGYAECFDIHHQADPDYEHFGRQIRTATANMYQRQLARLDKISLSYAIEARVPFLHKRFVETALAIDPRLKYKTGSSKAILREAFADRVPQRIRTMPKKRFGPAAGITTRYPDLQAHAKTVFETYVNQLHQEGKT